MLNRAVSGTVRQLVMHPVDGERESRGCDRLVFKGINAQRIIRSVHCKSLLFTGGIQVCGPISVPSTTSSEYSILYQVYGGTNVSCVSTHAILEQNVKVIPFFLRR